ncbi:alpha/beta fold hydrolase [Candidatus Woesearchaeota archaeon]|nr:alpha/beta fold hydrolase [Candidatus Woesearchaeota archaeon]
MTFLRALSEEIATLEELANAKKKSYLDAELPEVLLLPGYFLGKGSLHGLALHLQHSYDVARIEYPSLQDLEKTTLQLLEEIKAVTDLRGEAISLVGHSMGGLLATRIAQEYPSAVKKVIALGTPFHGTYGAYTQYPFHLLSQELSESSIRQMFPKSKFLEALLGRGFPENVQFVSIYSSDDIVVMPWRSSELPERQNTRNILLSDVGHLGLLGKKCYGVVDSVLKVAAIANVQNLNR